MRYPRSLAGGDTIAVTATSSGVGEAFESRLDEAVRMLRERGYDVVLGECLSGAQLTVVNGALGRLVWNDGERSLEQTLA